MKSFYKGAVLLFLSAFGFGLLPIFALFAYKGGIKLQTLLVLRFTIGTLIFFAIAFMQVKKIRVSKRDLLYLFILGGICYCLQSQFYFTSVKYISPSLASLFLYTYPTIVTLLSALVDREKITKEISAALSISFIGLILILGTSLGSVNSIGILFALGSALVYSVYIVLGNRVLKRIPPIVTSAFVGLFSAAGVFITGLFTHGISFQFAPATWGPILGLAFFSTVIAMLFFFMGMNIVGPAKASIISMTEPVFTVILSTLLLHDRITLMQLTGGLLVLAGAVLVILYRESKIAA